VNPRHLLNFDIAYKALVINKGRSILTALGIIFGVAAVISMLAIGNGAKKEILEQMKLVGVNNIVITPIVKQAAETKEEDDDNNLKGGQKKFSPGLTLGDAQAISAVIQDIEQVSPEIVYETNVVRDALQHAGKLVGVEPAYFHIYNYELETGAMFNSHNLENGDPVCIIGKGIQQRFFNKEAAVGKYLKCGINWYCVMGVLKERGTAGGGDAKLGIRDNNEDVYIPVQTMLIRYKNRALITRQAVERTSRGRQQKEPNYNQLDRLVVQVKNTETLQASADVITAMMKRRHFGVPDYDITIPVLLLKQQQRTKDIFNIVLGAIAAISLLVGGIGIMNIMLASVLERTKEIGIRMSLGATKNDIIMQFVIEAMLISVTGGIAGILLGVILTLLVSAIAVITTIISPLSIIISFTVAASIGLIFGITPARRAARLDPIVSLHYE
jgi:putative ABC transport system permease protein